MTTHDCLNSECPATDELDQLIHGQSDSSVALTEHVGNCADCQSRMDALASGGDGVLTTTIRQCNKQSPEAGSAMWPALSAVATALSATSVLPPERKAPRSGEIKLTFLRPSEDPAYIGHLGQFDIIREVGRGGMGVVLHAYDPCLQRDVAVKVLDPQLADNEIARQRFCREARAAAAVTHENLVAVHQVNEDDHSGIPYLVMQLIIGESLEERLRRVNKLSPVEVARLGMQAAAGLSGAHACGLIHRDIKPGNILLEQGTDKVKLTDFGLARAAEDVKLTRTGFVAGTPLYMAPEQARGDEVDARADLFSLGSVLYEAATGRAPFDAKTPLAVLRRVTDETQASLHDVESTMPMWLSDVTDRLLAKNPNERFQSASEVAEIFATELARTQSHTAAEPSTGMCGEARSTIYALHPRRKICVKSLARRVVPWVGGGLIGGLIVGLIPGSYSQNTNQTETLPIVRADSTAPTPLPLQEAVGPVWAVGFSPNGQRLAIGAEDGSLRLINPKHPETSRTLPKMSANIWSVDISSDGKQLVVSCDDSTVKIYNLDTYTSKVIPHPTSTKAAIFSPDGTKLATGDRDAAVRVFDLESVKPTELLGQSGTVHSLSYSPDGKQLASAGSDGKVRIWNKMTSDEAPLTLGDQKGAVYAVAFSPDESTPRLASAGWDSTVRIWNPQTGDQLHVLRGHIGDVWSLSFGHGGKILASAGSDGTIRIWDTETGNELQTVRGSERGYNSVRFAKDGKTIAAAGRDGNIRVWEID